MRVSYIEGEKNERGLFLDDPLRPWGDNARTDSMRAEPPHVAVVRVIRVILGQVRAFIRSILVRYDRKVVVSTHTRPKEVLTLNSYCMRVSYIE